MEPLSGVSHGIVPQTKLFDFKKLKINDEGRYSITRPYEAKQITTIIENGIFILLNKLAKNSIITDATAGVGGDTLSLSSSFKLVNSIEILEENFNLLNINCKRSYRKNINLYNADCLQLIPHIKQDVIYMDPPWGGVGYKQKENLKIYLGKYELKDAIKILQKSNSIIYLKLPLNVDLEGIRIHQKHIILNKKELPSFFLIQVKYIKDIK